MTTTHEPISGDRLVELLALIKEADSVELKLTVPSAHRRETVKALGIDPLDAQIRQVVFFDTPDLTLNQAGIVVRARRSQNAVDDTVVKLRPVVPHELPAGLRVSPNFGVEVDAMPGGYVCSGSLKALHSPTHLKELFEGARDIKKLFSKEQRAFYKTHAPEGLDLDSLAVLGPITVLKVKWRPLELAARKMVGEMWMYPDGSVILELSTKCLPGEAFQVAAETRAYLTERGVETDGEQQTKTKTALEFFAGELKG
jgi:hypothetical protein